MRKGRTVGNIDMSSLVKGINLKIFDFVRRGGYGSD